MYLLLKLFLIKNLLLIDCNLIELTILIVIKNLKITLVNLPPKILTSKLSSINGGNSIIFILSNFLINPFRSFFLANTYLDKINLLAFVFFF